MFQAFQFKHFYSSNYIFIVNIAMQKLQNEEKRESVREQNINDLS